MADLTGIDLHACESSRKRRTPASSPSDPRSMALREQARRSMPAACRWRGWTTSTSTRRSGCLTGRAPLHRRRRAHLPRHVRGRHERLLRPCAAPVVEAVASAWSSATSSSARRGRDRRRRAPRRPLRAAQVAVHPLGDPGKHRGDPPRARAHGTRDVLMFDAKYHGEGDATLVVQEDGKVVPERGLPRWIAAQARLIVQFNDVAALEGALEPGDVALVLAEPAMTNAGFLSPSRVSTRRCAGRPVTRHPARHRRDPHARVRLRRPHPRVGARAGLPHPRQGRRGRRPARGLRHARRDRLADRTARGVARRIGRRRGRGRDRRDAVRECSVDGGRARCPPRGPHRGGLRAHRLARRADGRGPARGDREAGVVVERGAVRRSRLLFLRAPAAHRRRRLARRRRPRAAGADPRVHGEPRRLGVRVVAGATVSVAHTAEHVDRYVEVFGSFSPR